MKIECLTTFLDGKDRYHEGETRLVDDHIGARFVAAGWARDTEGKVATGDSSAQEVNLDVQNGRHVTGSKTNG